MSIVSPATARLIETRTGGSNKGKDQFLELEFGIPHSMPAGFRVALHPAGHIPGSAQLFLESDRGSVLYTGDFQLRPNPCTPPAKAVSADVLIMETTFGLPRYQFPPTEQIVESIFAFCSQALDGGHTPVLLAYSLGKAQELIHWLGVGGFRVCLHDAVWKMTGACEQLGLQFPLCEKFSSGWGGGGVLIWPPSAARAKIFEYVPRPRTAMVSGWALDPGAIHRFKVDAAFPLSDHADYPDLLRFVREVNPAKVYTVHGYAREFSRDLRARGIEAWALHGPNQLEFSFPQQILKT